MADEWGVSFLPKAREDLHLLEPSRERRKHIVADILDEFRGAKAERITRALFQGSASASVTRLQAARTPGSLRVHVQGGLRATVLFLPAFRQAYVTHVFSKPKDPAYRRAPVVHDARVHEFVAAFSDFVGRV